MPHERRANKYWDVPPNGFEHMTVAEYKMLQAQGQVPRLSVQVCEEWKCTPSKYSTYVGRRANRRPVSHVSKSPPVRGEHAVWSG